MSFWTWFRIHKSKHDILDSTRTGNIFVMDCFARTLSVTHNDELFVQLRELLFYKLSRPNSVRTSQWRAFYAITENDFFTGCFVRTLSVSRTHGLFTQSQNIIHLKQKKRRRNQNRLRFSAPRAFREIKISAQCFQSFLTKRNLLNRRKSSFKVGDDVVDMLCSDWKADCALRDSLVGKLRVVKLGMCCWSRMNHKRLNVGDVRKKRENLQVVDEFPCRLASALDFKSEDWSSAVR